MNSFTRIAALGLIAVLVTTAGASALDRRSIGMGSNNTPIDVGNDYDPTPIDLDDDDFDPTPIDLPESVNVDGDYAPITVGGQVVKAGEVIEVLGPQLSCKLGGTDLLVANVGDQALPAGVKLKWNVASYGADGFARLNQRLGVGQKVRIAGALDGNATAGTVCTVDPV